MRLLEAAERASGNEIVQDRASVSFCSQQCSYAARVSGSSSSDFGSAVPSVGADNVLVSWDRK